MTTSALILFLVAAALLAAAVWFWVKKVLIVGRWTPWITSLLGVAAAIAGLAMLHEHKPVNVSNINILGDPSNPEAFAAGAAVAYFSVNLAPTGAQPFAIYQYDPTDHSATKLKIGGSFAHKPHSITAVPGTPEMVLFAAATKVLLWDGVDDSDYLECVAASTPAILRAYAVAADGADSFMLAEPEAGKIGTYKITPSADAPTYARVGAADLLGDGVSELALSSVAWRRAAFLAMNAGVATLHTWDGRGAPTVVADLTPSFLHSTDTDLLVAGVYSGSSLPRVFKVTGAGTVAHVPCSDGGMLQDVYGITYWDGDFWVLAKRDNQTKLWKVAGGALEFVAKYRDLVNGGNKPRGFVPLNGCLGFITGTSCFWNVGPRMSDHEAEPDLIKPGELVQTMWPFQNEALFAADGFDEDGRAMGVELWRWW